MAKPEFKSALIIGTGNGLSSSFARRCAAEGWRVSLAARDPEHLSDFCKEIGAKAYTCDATNAEVVASLFEILDDEGRTSLLALLSVVKENPNPNRAKADWAYALVES